MKLRIQHLAAGLLAFCAASAGAACLTPPLRELSPSSPDTIEANTLDSR